MIVKTLIPEWPAASSVNAVSTLRSGGTSTREYTGLNLADHVGDDPACVAENRRLLQQSLGLRQAPIWLSQVHGNRVIHSREESREADGVWTDEADTSCAVMTADCLPILLCDRRGSKVAAIHAGWRGLVGGIVHSAVAALRCEDLMAWLGPAIGPDAFEVGEDVRTAFVDKSPAAIAGFRQNDLGRWLADIYTLARLDLKTCGVDEIYGGGLCTFTDSCRFFSYRRDGQTGRMATLIWLH